MSEEVAAGKPVEAEKDPWTSALSTGLKIGVKKGRLKREDSKLIWGVIQRPIRRSLRSKGANHKNLMVACRDLVAEWYRAETQTDPIWFHMSEWIADHLPQLYRELLSLMVEYPICQ